MSFTLHADFSGLCLYVVHPETGRVAVLMPDCRGRTHGEDAFHEDETRAELHVGYIRLSLADLDFPLNLAGASSDAEGEPRYEVVHRFDRQVLEFIGEAEPGPVGNGLRFPDFQQIDPDLELLDGLFTDNPPPVLLMRTLLDGGELVAEAPAPEDQTWSFSKLFNPAADKPQYTGQFASFATWIREFEGNTLTLRITSFDGAPEAEFVLGPVPEGGTVRLIMANLCAYNPLEWSDLALRKVMGNDEDFKWLYRLLKPKASTFAAKLLNATFPIPERRGASGETRDDDCMSGTISAAFPHTMPEE